MKKKRGQWFQYSHCSCKVGLQSGVTDSIIGRCVHAGRGTLSKTSPKAQEIENPVFLVDVLTKYSNDLNLKFQSYYYPSTRFALTHLQLQGTVM